MPKQIIRGDISFLPPLQPGAEVWQEEASEENPPAVVLGWDRDTGTVTIVTRLLLAEVPPQGGRVEFDPSSTIAAQTAIVRSPIPAQYGYYVDLDRRGINDLIRNLRRARDGAFGRDE